ncbi:MAG: FAD-dependent oxidoreductase [Phycisphaerae bacterium]|nr:FAD-dependent oxidoreductase [Phycisphaerae bacterium]
MSQHNGAQGHTPHIRHLAARADDQPRIVVIGAGPTGLGAGYRLQELGYTNFTVYESLPFVGGLAHSFVDPVGFTWDIGGHVMFSHYTYYDGVFEKLMGEDYTLNDRESWVRIAGRWVPYPFQNNIRYLPREMAHDCIAGLIRAQTGGGTVKSHHEAKNFGEFIDAVFGEGIARHFMRPYNFKVWAYPPEMMNKQWIGERVAVIDYERALRNLILEKDDFGWGPNNRFKFPLRGGTGEFYRRFGPVLGLTEDGKETPHSRIRLRKRCNRIDVDTRTVYFDDGTNVPYDTLISTKPLDVLCQSILTGEVPERIRHAAGRLLHSGGHMVGIGIKRKCPSTKSWMYFPDDNCPFYRVTYLSNYSPFMTPADNTRGDAPFYSLLCETSCSPHKPVDASTIVEETIRGLENAGLLEPGERRDIVSTWHYYADYSYPTPSVDRDEILAEVIPWLESRGIYSRGRFGMWKYEVANTDHTLMQGVELANRLVLGEKETTIGVVYTITEDGREAAVHERSPVAGSGEKRLIEVKPADTATRRKPATAAAVGDLGAAPIGEEESGIGGG